MKNICRIAAAMLSVSLVLTAGFSGKPPEMPAADTTAETAETTASETAMGICQEASLQSFRQAMVETPALFGVAYFGYFADTCMDPIALIREQAPRLCGDLPFLLEIPADNVIGSSGDLFCIVPLDEEAAVSVSKGMWNDSSQQYIYENPLYFVKNGRPILLFCNREGLEPDTQLCISGPSGDVIWYPQTDDNRCAMPLRNENWEMLYLDFSPYRELLMKRHRDMKGEWVMPTAEMLADTTWVWDGILKDGREVRYQMSFRQDTLSVRWNDGFDAEDHVYPDAAWNLICSEETAILSIDFREFAGVLRYNLLCHEDMGQLYVAMDTVQAEMPVGWEPLYRFLTLPAVPEPVEMLGQWELAWTEVEGDRNESEPGTEGIDIFLNGEDGFRITLTDGITPGRSFYNKELAVCEGELFFGCGNDQWMACVGYMGKGDTVYSLTLLPEDTLLMELYWEMDGGVPMVAHKGYRRMK